MTTTSRPPGNPTRPAVRPTRHDFVETLKGLREWSGLTLKALEARHGILKVSTTSDYQRGVRWPRWEWVDAFVTACLTHGGLTDPVRVQAELAHWRTAWGYVEHQRTGQGQLPQTPPQADSAEESTPQLTGGIQPGAGDHEEAVEDPAGLRTVWPAPHRRATIIAALGLVALTALGAAATWWSVRDSAPGAPGGTSRLTTTPSNGVAPSPVQTTVSSPPNGAAPTPAPTTVSPPLLVPQAELSQQPSTSPPKRQILTPKSTSPSPIPSNQNRDANTTENSYNYDNHGVDNRGGTINGSIVGDGNVNNSGNTYNR